jgi:hypothetical protein
MFLPIQDDFTPDASILEGGVNGSSGANTQCGPNNVINTGKGFAPFGATIAITSATGLGAASLGLFSLRASNGTYYTFGGSAAALKLVNGTGWTDVTRSSGGAYTTASTEVWRFASFGNRVIAVNYTDETQTYLAGTDSVFSALSGSPPKARYITISGDFVVLGYINDGTVYPFRVRWSAQGDPTASWASSATTQADFDDLDSNNGPITGVAGYADYFYVFQERAITRYDYVGSPLVYSAREVAKGIGCFVPGSICQVGERVFFISRDGFKELSPNGIRHIGAGKLDIHWWNVIYASSDIPATLLRTTACGDPNFPVVHFGTSTSSVLSQSLLYSYNYLFDKWTATTPDSNLNPIGIIYNSSFLSGAVAGFRFSDNKLYHMGLSSQTSTATFHTKTLQTTETGNPVNITRTRLAIDTPGDLNSTIVCLVNEPGGSFPGYGLATGATLTQITNSRDFVGRVLCDVIRFKISVTSWILSRSYVYGIKIIEMSESGKR